MVQTLPTITTVVQTRSTIKTCSKALPHRLWWKHGQLRPMDCGLNTVNCAMTEILDCGGNTVNKIFNTQMPRLWWKHSHNKMGRLWWKHSQPVTTLSISPGGGVNTTVIRWANLQWKSTEASYWARPPRPWGFPERWKQ